MASSHIPCSLQSAVGPHRHRVALYGLEKIIGHEVASQVMEFLPRASIIAARAKLDLLHDMFETKQADSLIQRGLSAIRPDIDELPTGKMVELELARIEQEADELISGRNMELEISRVFTDFDLNNDDALDLKEFRQLTKSFVLHKRLSRPKQVLEQIVGRMQTLIKPLLQAMEPAINRMLEAVISEQCANVEKAVAEIDRAFELQHLRGEHPIADEVFAQLCSESGTPGRVGLPEFVDGFISKVRRLKQKIFNAERDKILQKAMQAMESKIGDVVEEAHQEHHDGLEEQGWVSIEDLTDH